ncbi:hypothetical protein ACFX2I_026684 [Malus domestica]
MGTNRSRQSASRGRSDSSHLRVTRTSSNRISLISWWVKTERSRRRVGLVERRSCWMHNHTWPRHINRSLLTHTTVIRKLSGGKRSGHIPYRDSKLTQPLYAPLAQP